MRHAAVLAGGLCLARHLGGCVALPCWSGDITAEACCGRPPRREDCWTGAVGLTRETCCELRGAARGSPEKWRELERLQDFGRSVFKALVALELGGALGCRGSTRHLLAALQDALSPEEHAAARLAWEEAPGAVARAGVLEPCAGRVGFAHLRLALMEPLLVVWPLESQDTRHLLERFRELAPLLRRLLEARSASRWRSEARAAPRPLYPAAPALVEAVHVAMVASVGRPPFGRKAMAGIRSALFFARLRPVHFHLVVDRAGAADLRRELAALEPWLRARGRFQLYRSEGLRRAWRQVRAVFPAECLNYSARYGSPGFLRLFPQDVVRGPEARVLAWVDAGDFVFLEDPALLLEHHGRFQEGQVAAAPQGHVLPFQLFDLERMRRSAWRRHVREAFREAYAAEGPGFCHYGEGNVFERLTRGDLGRLWHWLPSTWAYEPWAEWMPGFGLVDLWSPRGLGEVWRGRVFPGQEDFASLRVFCPDLQVTLANYVLYNGASEREMKAGVNISLSYHGLAVGNRSYKDWKGQHLRCNDRVQGLHLILPFHDAPWAQAFLNFWAGGRVWDGDWLRGRDLRA